MKKSTNEAICNFTKYKREGPLKPPRTSKHFLQDGFIDEFQMIKMLNFVLISSHLLFLYLFILFYLFIHFQEIYGGNCVPFYKLSISTEKTYAG